jgi:hypothetical protein
MHRRHQPDALVDRRLTRLCAALYEQEAIASGRGSADGGGHPDWRVAWTARRLLNVCCRRSMDDAGAGGERRVERTVLGASEDEWRLWCVESAVCVSWTLS